MQKSRKYRFRKKHTKNRINKRSRKYIKTHKRIRATKKRAKVGGALGACSEDPNVFNETDLLRCKIEYA